MDEWIWTLKPLLLGTQWSFHVGDWLTCSRERAVRLHDEHGAMAVCCLKSALRELDTAAPDQAADIRAFAFRFLFGLPVEAREQYGTFGLGDLMNYKTTKQLLLGTRVYPTGSPLSDAEVGGRLARLLHDGALEVETQDVPPHARETQVSPPIVEVPEVPPVKQAQVVKRKKRVSE
jgi:hypothetical protein